MWPFRTFIRSPLRCHSEVIGDLIVTALKSAAATFGSIVSANEMPLRICSAL